MATSLMHLKSVNMDEEVAKIKQEQQQAAASPSALPAVVSPKFDGQKIEEMNVDSTARQDMTQD